MISTIEALENYICNNWKEVNTYLDSYQKDIPVPIYSSVDIRESSKKVAPIDLNFYPAGFNNICMLDLDHCAREFKKNIGDVKHIGILTESHTKNTFYLDHLATLKRTLEQEEYQVSLISLDKDLFIEGKAELELTSKSGWDITLFQASVVDDKIKIKDSTIDYILMNNDQSSPIEDVNWNKLETSIEPTPLIGWYKRNKITHFEAYQKVANDFCLKFEIEPSLVQAHFDYAENVDFLEKESLSELANKVEKFKAQIGPDKKIFLKGAQGTYGMGISVINNGDDVINMNRKNRNKMNAGKNNLKFTSVLIQEGIDTVIQHESLPAEISIYLVGGKSIGGFMRTNSLKKNDENLNSRGMVFQKFCLSEIRQSHDHKAKEAMYSVLARLSTIAGGLEIKKELEHQEKI